VGLHDALVVDAVEGVVKGLTFTAVRKAPPSLHPPNPAAGGHLDWACWRRAACKCLARRELLRG
jgi:hypothetical protein